MLDHHIQWIAARERGQTFREISEASGFSEMRIYKVVRSTRPDLCGYMLSTQDGSRRKIRRQAPRPKVQRKWDDAERLQLAIRWAKGESVNAIAAALDRPKGAIIGQVHRLELHKRPSPVYRSA